MLNLDIGPLSVIEKRSNVSKSRACCFQEKTLKSMIQEDIDEAISISYTPTQFHNELQLLGYEYKISEKNISVKHPMSRKSIRLKSLGSDYTNERLMKRILGYNKVQQNGLERYDCLGFDIWPYFENYMKTNFYAQNKLGYTSYEKNGDLYIYKMVITNGENSSQTIEKQFVVKLLDGTNFVMSFEK